LANINAVDNREVLLEGFQPEVGVLDAVDDNTKMIFFVLTK
jgi:hypothetical protein